MIGNRLSRMARGLALFGSLALSGCVVATDLINPSLLTSLGFDPQTVVPPQGKVVVAFQNSTNFNAAFASAYLKTDFGVNAQVNLVTAGDVGPGETRNAVLDCPVAIISPAPDIDNLGATQDGILAVVANGTEVAEVAYLGQPMLNGRDFECGDVILIQLIAVGDGFAVQVQLLPGR